MGVGWKRSGLCHWSGALLQGPPASGSAAVLLRSPPHAHKHKTRLVGITHRLYGWRRSVINPDRTYHLVILVTPLLGSRAGIKTRQQTQSGRAAQKKETTKALKAYFVSPPGS